MPLIIVPDSICESLRITHGIGGSIDSTDFPGSRNGMIPGCLEVSAEEFSQSLAQFSNTTEQILDSIRHVVLYDGAKALHGVPHGEDEGTELLQKGTEKRFPGCVSSLQRDSSGKNPFDFAIKWGYNVEKYWWNI